MSVNVTALSIHSQKEIWKIQQSYPVDLLMLWRLYKLASWWYELVSPEGFMDFWDKLVFELLVWVAEGFFVATVFHFKQVNISKMEIKVSWFTDRTIVINVENHSPVCLQSHSGFLGLWTSKVDIAEK